jgi:transposase
VEARSSGLVADLEAIISAQAATTTRLESALNERDERICALEALVEDLQMRLKQNSSSNSSNSSKPPSSDPSWLKPGRKKKAKSTKPSGGQPGHRAHARALIPSDQVSETVHHVPEKCRRCDGALTADDDIADALQRHQISELPPIKVIVTEHQLHGRACKSCGEVTKATFPSSFPKSVFGPHLQAEVVHLIANCHLSRRGLMKYAKESWGTLISMGSVNRIERNVSQALEQPYNDVLEAVKAAPIRHADETGWPQDGKRGWLWTVGSVIATVFMIAGSRASEVFTSLMGVAVQEGCFVTDRYRGYCDVEMKQRGICHAHIKRDFVKIEGQGGFFATLGASLRFQHTRMFELWHRHKAGELSLEELRIALTPIKWRMYRLLKLGRSGSHKKIAGMCADMLRHWFAFWKFASVPGMEPTNNAAERSLRKAVLWRKGCFGTRSTAGSLFAERMLTVAETCRQNERNVLEYLSAAIKANFSGNPAPQLIPTAGNEINRLI